MGKQQILAEVLRSVSDVLFPEALGDHPVEVNSRGISNDTPLHVMVWRRDHEAVKLLIEAGADVNAKGDMGETPLHVAISNKDECTIEFLLKAGADPNIECEFGDTAKQRAITKRIQINTT